MISELLAEKIKTRTARVGVVGLGYVGLPLAVEYAEAGFHVTGIDLSAPKTARVNAADSYIGDVPSAALEPLVRKGLLCATTHLHYAQNMTENNYIFLLTLTGFTLQ